MSGRSRPPSRCPPSALHQTVQAGEVGKTVFHSAVGDISCAPRPAIRRAPSSPVPLASPAVEPCARVAFRAAASARAGNPYAITLSARPVRRQPGSSRALVSQIDLWAWRSRTQGHLTICAAGRVDHTPQLTASQLSGLGAPFNSSSHPSYLGHSAFRPLSTTYRTTAVSRPPAIPSAAPLPAPPTRRRATASAKASRSQIQSIVLDASSALAMALPRGLVRSVRAFEPPWPAVWIFSAVCAASQPWLASCRSPTVRCDRPTAARHDGARRDTKLCCRPPRHRPCARRHGPG